MPGIVVGQIAEPDFEAVVEEFAVWNPSCRLGCGSVDRDATLASAGVRYLWLESGRGEVLLPKGTRTQEGDGKPLGAEYVPDRTPSAFLDALDLLAARIGTFDSRVRGPVKAILERRHGNLFLGDIAGELWLIEESGVPRDERTTAADAAEALERVYALFRDVGWSEKAVDGWEPIGPGDQLAVTPSRPLRVRGAFRYWYIEIADQAETHVSSARRLPYLRDTAGGCNFAFDAFRRLPLTWVVGTGTAENPDGINRVNSHIVNIAAETSRTHFHPTDPIGGGQPQSEMYLVLDPKEYGLKTYGRTPRLTTFPVLDDLFVYEETPLKPGMTVYIRPGTGHRGIDAYVNVVTLPGFKPHNEVYLDQKIKDATDGRAPYNAELTV